MRTEPLAACERAFILAGFSENLRVDGRTNEEFREVKVIVGTEHGSALAFIGKTKVLAYVSCSLVEPKSARGNVGVIDVQVDMSPLGSPANENGRLGFKGVELTRVLELLLRDCNMVDLESLCIRAQKQVWQIRVDVHVLDADGALIDCAVIAAVAALAHFQLPEISVLSDSVIVYGANEKMTVSLNIYHMPICVSFGFCTDCDKLVMDPTEREELCLKGTLVIAGNKRHEICTLHQSGNLILNKEIINRCASLAIERAIDITELINSVIVDDKVKRSKREKMPGFTQLISLDVLTSHECEPNELIAPAVTAAVLEVTQTNEISVTSKDRYTHIGEAATPLMGERVGQEVDSEDMELISQVLDIAEAVSTEQVDNLNSPNLARSDDVDDLLDGIEEEIAELLSGTESASQSTIS